MMSFRPLTALVLALVALSPLCAQAELLKAPPAPVAAAGGKPFDGAAIGRLQTYTTRYEDTLVHLARDYQLGYVEIVTANPGVDPWIPGDGTELVLPTMHLLPQAPREGVVINLAEMRMYIYTRPGEPPQTFPIGIGRAGLLTPVGTTTVVRKVDGPVWHPTDRMRKEDPTLPEVVPPGPENPMGSHALYLGWSTYAIHGTNKPFAIGRRVSSGCIRMYPEDITKVYQLVPTGTKVITVDQPIKVAWVGDELYLEAHPTQDQADALEKEGVMPGYDLSEDEMRLILKTAGPGVHDLDWAKIRKVVRERRGYPIVIAKAAARTAQHEPAAAVSTGAPVKSD